MLDWFDAVKIGLTATPALHTTESFNRVVCDYLAQELDLASRQKTLIFCATDPHADLVVHLLKQSFRDLYGTVDDDAVIKITRAADKPLQLLRRYKNERDPNVAVTVDLLTTGIDVPEICNLVFLRRVNSRILFDQMLGRATRLCDDIGKERFRIFDAVRIYEALSALTQMQPVVVDPAISFTQLAAELSRGSDDDELTLARDQFLAKLQRKRRHSSEAAARDFETRAGLTPAAFIQALRAMPLPDLAAWFTQHPDLGEVLDRKDQGPAAPLYISNHPDQLRSTEHGYGQAQRPADYLAAFSEYIRGHRNQSPALLTVLTRPRDLTRKQLREQVLELDQAGFSEANLIVDRAAFDDPDLVFRREGGGFARLDRLFGGDLGQVLERFNEAIWESSAA